MAIPTVDSGDEVRAVDHNSIVGLLNGTPDDATTAYAQPVKLNRFNDPALYSLTVGNQNTTNGLIAQFQYGAVGSATTVVSIRKRGVEARLNDIGGQVFLLDAYAADGITLHAATGDAAGIAALEASGAQLTANDAAWTAALAAIQAVGGGRLQLGPGTYIAPSSAVTLIDNLTVAGVGMFGTILKHRKSTSSGWSSGWPAITTFVSAGVFRNKVTFRDFAVDGDRTHNNAFSGGLSAIEVAADGDDNAILGVRVFNWNWIAMEAAGHRNTIDGCRIEGPMLGSYTPWAPSNTDYGGWYGISNPGNVETSHLTVTNNVVYGCRNNGATAMGDHAVIDGNRLYENHRDISPTGSGGGQLSVGFSPLGAGVQGARYSIISNNTVGGTTLGTYAVGIEINTVISLASGVTIAGSDVVCVGNAISGQPGVGIAVNDASGVLVIGNTVRGSASNGIAVAAGSPSIYFAIANNFVADNGAGLGAAIWGISIGGGCGYYQVTGNLLSNNGGTGGTTGQNQYTDTSLHATRHVWGNVVGSGTAPPNYVATDVTLAGDLAVTGFVWTTFSPALLQGNSPTQTVNYARYRKLGKLVHVQASITATNVGTGGNAILFVLPAGLESARTGVTANVGTAFYFDSGTTNRFGAALATTSLTIALQADAKAGQLGTASDALTVANNDVFVVNLKYELA